VNADSPAAAAPEASRVRWQSLDLFSAAEVLGRAFRMPFQPLDHRKILRGAVPSRLPWVASDSLVQGCSPLCALKTSLRPDRANRLKNKSEVHRFGDSANQILLDPHGYRYLLSMPNLSIE
jgi:hypothetical protein